MFINYFFWFESISETMADQNDSEMNDDQSFTEEVKTAGQPLSDFLMQLEDYTPTVSLSD